MDFLKLLSKKKKQTLKLMKQLYGGTWIIMKQTHEGEIKIIQKIFTINDIDNIIELIRHDQYALDIKVNIVFSNGEKISHANQEILKSAEVKNKHIQEIRMVAKVFDDSKKDYEDRTECEIDVLLKTETCSLHSSHISIDSNDEALYHIYYDRFHAAVTAMKKQAFPSFLNYTGVHFLCWIPIAIFVWIYLLLRFQPNDEWFMLLFAASIFASSGFLFGVEKLYPNNEIILGEEYFYPPKKKKQILSTLFATLIVMPITDLIVQFFWK